MVQVISRTVMFTTCEEESADNPGNAFHSVHQVQK